MTAIGPGVPDQSEGGNKTPANAELGSEPIRVTTLELFFDLIFAFTLTQLAVALTEHTAACSGGCMAGTPG